MRARGFKYIDAPKPELYYLATDGGERRNIIGDRPSMAAYLQETLEGEYQKFSAGPEEPPQPEQMDRATIERLKSLGYLGFASATAKLPSTEGLPDPKGPDRGLRTVAAGVPGFPRKGSSSNPTAS